MSNAPALPIRNDKHVGRVLLQYKIYNYLLQSYNE